METGPQGFREKSSMDAKDKAEIFPKDPNKTYALMEIVKGSSLQVDKGPEQTVLTWPHLVLRELLLFLVVFIVIVGLAMVFDAPLEEPANPLHPPNPAKAPWYFVGIQEWVSYSAFLGGILVPALVMVILLFLPYLDRHPKGVGVWFSRHRRKANLLFCAFVLAVVVPILVGQYLRGPNWEFYWPWEEWPKVSTLAEGP
jgi:quinol-cytochrome oxidoreductase complex cytochrome b subunit